MITINRKLLYFIIGLSLLNILLTLFIITIFGFGYKEYNDHKQDIVITINKAKSLSGKLDELTSDVLGVKYYIRDSIVNKLCGSYIGKYICSNNTINH